VPDDRNLARYPTWSHGEALSSVDNIKNFKKSWDFFLIETEKDFSQGTHLQILGHTPNSITFDNDKPEIEKIKVPFVEGMFGKCLFTAKKLIKRMWNRCICAEKCLFCE
jgi:hypothetical protein